MGLIDHHGHKKDAYWRFKELMKLDRDMGVSPMRAAPARA
jgi:hypothetical protein